jgi:hypothetical protein
MDFNSMNNKRKCNKCKHIGIISNEKDSNDEWILRKYCFFYKQELDSFDRYCDDFLN